MRKNDWEVLVALLLAAGLGMCGWGLIQWAASFAEHQEYGWLLGFVVSGGAGCIFLFTSGSLFLGGVAEWFSGKREEEQ